jgi:hypothetical protein
VHILLASGHAGVTTSAADIYEHGPLLQKPYEHGDVLKRVRLVMGLEN